MDWRLHERHIHVTHRITAKPQPSAPVDVLLEDAESFDPLFGPVRFVFRHDTYDVHNVAGCWTFGEVAEVVMKLRAVDVPAPGALLVGFRIAAIGAVAPGVGPPFQVTVSRRRAHRVRSAVGGALFKARCSLHTCVEVARAQFASAGALLILVGILVALMAFRQMSPVNGSVSVAADVIENRARVEVSVPYLTLNPALVSLE